MRVKDLMRGHPIDVTRARVVDLRGIEDTPDNPDQDDAPEQPYLIDYAVDEQGWLFAVAFDERAGATCSWCEYEVEGCPSHSPGQWARQPREESSFDHLVLVQDPHGVMAGVAVVGGFLGDNEFDAVMQVNKALLPLLDDDVEAASSAWAVATRLHAIIMAMPLADHARNMDFSHHADLEPDQAREQMSWATLPSADLVRVWKPVMSGWCWHTTSGQRRGDGDDAAFLHQRGWTPEQARVWAEVGVSTSAVHAYASHGWTVQQAITFEEVITRGLLADVLTTDEGDPAWLDTRMAWSAATAAPALTLLAAAAGLTLDEAADLDPADTTRRQELAVVAALRAEVTSD